MYIWDNNKSTIENINAKNMMDAMEARNGVSPVSYSPPTNLFEKIMDFLVFTVFYNLTLIFVYGVGVIMALGFIYAMYGILTAKV